MLLQEKESYRIFFQNAWVKHRNRELLEAVEKHAVSVMQQHPQFQPYIDSVISSQYHYSQNSATQYNNPFMHMALHMAIQEQVQINNPIGIRQIHTELTYKYSDTEAAEHVMMECLMAALWKLQSEQSKNPNIIGIDAREYLYCLRKLL